MDIMALPGAPTAFVDDGPLAEPIPIDTRLPRPERAQSIHANDGIKATVELASIMTTASNPVSPGPSSPPLDQVRMQDFIPPTRPSSTPFPQPEPRSADLLCFSCPDGDLAAENYTIDGFPFEQDATAMEQDQFDAGDVMQSVERSPEQQTQSLWDTTSQAAEYSELPIGMNLNDLPAEIHECVLDHLFGFRVSPTSKSSITRWGTALRHSRRRELSELALVSRVWRTLIQERLYRHIKLKATVDSMNDSFAYFALHPHLRPYVKHIEIWFPVFQPKYGPLALSTTNTLPTVTVDGLTNASYVLPADNCSLEEAFYFVNSTFPEVCVLTLEGGERKKAPKVRHWIREGDSDEHGRKSMPRIHSVRTLVCKGQWNLIRGVDDFEALASALPNLSEWQASYSKPKSKSYLTMAGVLPRLPRALTSLSLCLEGDYRREINFPPYFLKVSNKLHFCTRLAEAAAGGLEHLSYTGRVCRVFFDLTASLSDPRCSRLRSIDLTVKNCCRHVLHWNESGSGITDMNFIRAFEGLVLAGIRALGKLKSVEYLRIRYVDLDSPVPPLNPYFLLRDGWCSGVWSDDIVAELNRARPDVRFEDLADSFGEVGYNKDGRMTISPEFPRSRVLSLKIANYALLSGGISIT